MTVIRPLSPSKHVARTSADVGAATSQRVPYMLFDPAQWIDPSAATPAMASTIEVKIARDLEWLLGGRTVPLPGRKRLGWALHQTFHSRTE